ncbi:MAG: fumarylacetoacetate hydrolase family protein [Acidiferrobacterales bacterium]
MKLASLKSGGSDGTLIVVNRNLTRACKVPEHALTLQAALEDWERTAPALAAVCEALNTKKINGFELDFDALASPLPRAYQWLDGSAYLTHVERVRKARGAEMPPSFLSDPLMYQGGSDDFLGPRDSIFVADEKWGVDFEAEVSVITDDVPMGAAPSEARGHIKLLMLVNDVSLRNLIPAELAKGFGFLHGKPASAFSPVAVTPDELGETWDGGKVHLPLLTLLNDELFGNPDTGADMQFDFPALVSHAAKTRRLSAGTIVGSGTISNEDLTRGCSCIAERRVLEIIDTGKAVTPFMHYGDRVRIEMLDSSGASIFGAIEQVVQKYKA